MPIAGSGRGTRRSNAVILCGPPARSPLGSAVATDRRIWARRARVAASRRASFGARRLHVVPSGSRPRRSPAMALTREGSSSSFGARSRKRARLAARRDRSPVQLVVLRPTTASTAVVRCATRSFASRTEASVPNAGSDVDLAARAGAVRHVQRGVAGPAHVCARGSPCPSVVQRWTS
jgi:hypothetical protein